MGRAIEGDFVFVYHPIKVTPDLAPVQALRALCFRQVSGGLYHSQGHRHMGVVLVGEIMGVYHSRLSQLQQQCQVLHGVLVGAVLHHPAGIVEQDLGCVITHHRCFFLLLGPYFAHRFVGVVPVQIIARRTTAIRDYHSGQPPVRLLETSQDAVNRHDLQVILMGADCHVGGSGKGFPGREAVRNKHLSRIESKHPSYPPS